MTMPEAAALATRLRSIGSFSRAGTWLFTPAFADLIYLAYGFVIALLCRRAGLGRVAPLALGKELFDGAKWSRSNASSRGSKPAKQGTDTRFIVTNLAGGKLIWGSLRHSILRGNYSPDDTAEDVPASGPSPPIRALFVRACYRPHPSYRGVPPYNGDRKIGATSLRVPERQ